MWLDCNFGNFRKFIVITLRMISPICDTVYCMIAFINRSVDFEFVILTISTNGQGYNAECGKSAMGILQNGDAELTLKLTLILALFRITIPIADFPHAAYRIIPLPCMYKKTANKYSMLWYKKTSLSLETDQQLTICACSVIAEHV